MTATTAVLEIYADAHFAIVATPTKYDAQNNSFYTSSVEAVMVVNTVTAIALISTVLVGCVTRIRAEQETDQFVVLREGLWHRPSI